MGDTSSSDSSFEDGDDLNFHRGFGTDRYADTNPRKRRREVRNAKEDAALGIFGSESEDEGLGKRWKKKTLRDKSMRFVKTGDSLDDEAGDNEELDEEEMTDERNKSFTPTPLGEKSNNEPNFTGRDSSEQMSRNGTLKNVTMLGKEFVPSSATMPKLLFPEIKISTPAIARPSAFSASASKSEKASKTTPAINTGSFAAKMMAKMGYKHGEGLGKEGQGRSHVIEVTLRPQGVGLGAVKEKSKQEVEEERRQAKIRGEKYSDDEELVNEGRKKSKKKSLMDGGKTKKKASKTEYKTIEELQRAAPGLHVPDTFVPILDMTGSGRRLITSNSGISKPTEISESTEQIESNKLVRRVQNQLSIFVEEWKNLEERKAYIEMVISQQQKEIEEIQQQFDAIQSFSNETQTLSKAVQDMELDPVIKTLSITSDLSKLEPLGRKQDLTEIAVAAIHPFLSQAVEGWQPLEDPKLSGMVPQLLKLRQILGVASSEKGSSSSPNFLNEKGIHRVHSKSSTAYESMIYKIIFPKIVFAINNNWDVYDPASLQLFFETWGDLLPPFVRSQILGQAVVGKLNTAMSSWNPKRGRTRQLPHLWLFPWLQYLPSHHVDPKSSNGLVSDVKRKYRKLVDSWDFHKGVVPGLQKWRDVLYVSSENDQWSPLIMNHVLPSMSRFLKNQNNFMVNPNDQEPFMSSLQGIFAWTDIVKSRTVGQIIVDTVFPLWHDALHQWLTVVGPNAEIDQWFDWWKDDVFPEGIKKLKIIQDEFDKGHDMINHALDLGSKAATHLPLPKIATTPPPSPPSPIITHSASPLPEKPTFRHIIEDWCIENDLQLLPEKKILHKTGPLHRITAAGNGKNGTLVYFKGDEIWALSKIGANLIDLKIDWTSEESKDVLLGMAWQNVQ
ncbi:hypothetical protein K3495_g3666 [Podosphaera aphanis]|nr:hypothetical protein K3495_g3666 [Podosphaera aphanis]